jgi:bifunctional DNase/RNase
MQILAKPENGYLSWLCKIMKQVNVLRVGLDVTSGHAVVILDEPEQKRLLPIWIGLTEANAISFALGEIHTDRPLTHQLLFNVIQSLNYSVERVEINEIKDGAYLATVRLKEKNLRCKPESTEKKKPRRKAIDARPSDAIALAILEKAPIFVADSVLQQGGISAEQIQAANAPEGADKPVDDAEFKNFLQTVNASDFKLKEES